MLRRFSLRGKRVPIPSVTTSKAQPQPIDYTKGLFTGLPNDLQPKSTLRYVMDMRFNGLGKYKTRKGCDHYSVAIGEAVNVQVTSTTGAADKGISTTTWQAEKLTATATGVADRVDIRLKNSAAATGTIIVALYSNNAGSPGTLLATTSVSETTVTSSYAYCTAYFMEAPSVTNGSIYWVVAYLQESGTGTMYVSSTTNTTNAKVSTNSGQSWSAGAYSLNVKLYTATAGGVKGTTRIYRPDGTGITFFAHGTNLYKINDVTGATTSVDSTLSSSSTFLRAEYVNDVLYYVDGVGKPHKYDFSSSSTVSASPYNATDIMEHVGILFFFDKDDPTRLFYTNFADYETFTSTDFIYVPAPKKADHLTAMAKLNGILYPFTKRNKFMLMGQDNATFRLDEAYAQKGTFSQESVVYDENYIYFASDDGVYQFNGTSEKNILEGVLNDYTGILHKDDIHLQLHDNRLYIWYRPNGEAEVSECFVYNTLYKVIESVDSTANIGRSFARHDTTDLFLQASNRAGVIYYSEQSTNDYNTLGSPLQAEVRTHYEHFGSPQQVKRITYWRPILESVAGDYTLQAGFAADYSDDITYTDVALQGSGYTYDDATSLYDTATYAAGGSSTDTTLNIFGSAYRWQRRYKHHAAHEPIEFAGEVLKVETQRLR
jgi:hypothetical protein